MKKILFIGDLRYSSNYGAVGTTTCLLEMLDKKKGKIEIQLIDCRSYNNVTPIEGWNIKIDNEYKYEIPCAHQIKSKIKRALKNIGMYKYMAELLKGFQHAYEISHYTEETNRIPEKLREYDGFVSKVIKNECLRYEKRLLEWSDIVIINAEGSIVNGTDKHGKYRSSGVYLLFMAFMAKKTYQKKVYIINHTVDPQNRNIMEIISTVYPSLDGVFVRERLSQQLLLNIKVENPTFIPDALFSFKPDNNKIDLKKLKSKVDFDKPYICIGDSSGFNDKAWNLAAFYSKLVAGLKAIVPQIVYIDGLYSDTDFFMEIEKSNIPTFNFFNCNIDELYYILEHSKLYLSGRWHPSILALMGHTPIVLWGSDSHKTEALYDLIGYKFRFFDIQTLHNDVDDIIDEARTILLSNLEDNFKLVEQYKATAILNIEEIFRREDI